MHPGKNSLSIRLTEPVVSLRSTAESASRHHDGDVLPPAIIRGLLTLELAKPTKISSIELKLQAKATTHFVRGAGPSRTDVTEQYKVRSTSAVLFKAGSAPQARPRATSARPRAQFPGGHTGQHGVRLSGIGTAHWQAPSDPHPMSRSASLDPRSLGVRRQPTPESDDLDMDNDGSISQLDRMPIGPAPPYPSQPGQRAFLSADVRPCVTGRSPSVASSLGGTGVQRSPVRPRSLVSSDIPCGSPTSSEHSLRDFGLSRTSSIEEVPEDEDESVDSCVVHPDTIACNGLTHVATGSPSRISEPDYRGRSHSRFSLASIVHVMDAMRDRVRSRSPREASRPWSDEHEERGRSLAKGKGKAQVGTHSVRHVLPRIGIAEPSAADGANDQRGDGWVTFPEGTYTYPIFFTIPNNSPPTMRADHGSLIWKVKAEVEWPSAFKSKMTAQKEVIVVHLLAHNESEEVERIELQKQWEDQLLYRIQIPGRGFPVGGKVPFQLTITPWAKIKVHGISVSLDERTEYYTGAQLRARADTIQRATLLVLRHNSLLDRYSEPILPLTSEEPDAFRKSPLYRFLRPGEDESEVASSFMGCGPWTIRHELRVPDSCTVLRPSNQTKGSNIMVHHTLKVTLRVEREEGTETAGRKKLYDIMIHIPMQILSCWCTSAWTSLPCYDEAPRPEGDLPEDTSTCPCRARPQVKAQRHSGTLPTPLGRRMSLPTSSTSPRALDLFPSESLASRGWHLHERLMSGLVSETGESPPSYERFEAAYV